MYVPGFEPTSSEFLGECVTHWATVADAMVNDAALVYVGEFFFAVLISFFSVESKVHNV